MLEAHLSIQKKFSLSFTILTSYFSVHCSLAYVLHCSQTADYLLLPVFSEFSLKHGTRRALPSWNLVSRTVFLVDGLEEGVEFQHSLLVRSLSLKYGHVQVIQANNFRVIPLFLSITPNRSQRVLLIGLFDAPLAAASSPVCLTLDLSVDLFFIFFV